MNSDTLAACIHSAVEGAVLHLTMTEETDETARPVTSGDVSACIAAGDFSFSTIGIVRGVPKDTAHFGLPGHLHRTVAIGDRCAVGVGRVRIEVTDEAAHTFALG